MMGPLTDYLVPVSDKEGFSPTTRAVVTLLREKEVDTVTLMKMVMMLPSPTWWAQLLIHQTMAPMPRYLNELEAISNNPKHSMYSDVRLAFDFVQQCREDAGLAREPWPMPMERVERRLVWENTTSEIKAAFRSFHSFVRQGLIPFAVDSEGNAVNRIWSFDPFAGEIVFRVCG